MLIVAPGCIDSSEPKSDTGPEPTSDTGPEPTSGTGPEPTTGTGTDSHENCETGMEQTGGPDPDCETDSDTATSETGPVEDPWSNVPCGRGACVGNEVCVQLAGYCDMSPCRMGGRANWIEEPPACWPFPDHCDPANPKSCLRDEYCNEAETGFSNFQAGHLECIPDPGDCYCIS